MLPVFRRLFGFFVSCLSCDETSTPSRRASVVSSPPLISSCYGLALFSCLRVNKLSCLPVLIQGEFLHQPPPTPPDPHPPATQAELRRVAFSLSKENQQRSRRAEPPSQSRLCVNLCAVGLGQPFPGKESRVLENWSSIWMTVR